MTRRLFRKDRIRRRIEGGFHRAGQRIKGQEPNQANVKASPSKRKELINIPDKALRKNSLPTALLMFLSASAEQGVIAALEERPANFWGLTGRRDGSRGRARAGTGESSGDT